MVSVFGLDEWKVVKIEVEIELHFKIFVSWLSETDY